MEMKRAKSAWPKPKYILTILCLGTAIGAFAIYFNYLAANVKYGALSLESQEVNVGRKTVASVRLSNSGYFPGSKTVVLVVNVNKHLVRTVEVSGRRSVEATFSLPSNRPGVHKIRIQGGPHAEYTVHKIERPATGTIVLDKTGIVGSPEALYKWEDGELHADSKPVRKTYDHIVNVPFSNASRLPNVSQNTREIKTDILITVWSGKPPIRGHGLEPPSSLIIQNDLSRDAIVVLAYHDMSDKPKLVQEDPSYQVKLRMRPYLAFYMRAGEKITRSVAYWEFLNTPKIYVTSGDAWDSHAREFTKGARYGWLELGPPESAKPPTPPREGPVTSNPLPIGRGVYSEFFARKEQIEKTGGLARAGPFQMPSDTWPALELFLTEPNRPRLKKSDTAVVPVPGPTFDSYSRTQAIIAFPPVK